VRTISAILLTVSAAVGLGFGEDNPALHQLSHEQVVKTQHMLATFACPKDAAPKACRSFKELVHSGDSELLTSFMPAATLPPALTPSFAWLVFDDKADNFWVFTAFGGLNGVDKDSFFESNLLYVRWFEGQASTARAASLRFVSGQTQQFTQEGVHMELNGDSLTASEELTSLENHKTNTTIAIKLSTLRTSIVYKDDAGYSRTTDTHALKYSNRK
jgi:hypothetical protein